MSETLEPRRVERPYLGRWVITAFALLLRFPVGFGAAIALIAIVDLLSTDVIPVRFIDAGWTLVLGTLLLPVFWIVLSLLSRQSDRALRRSELLQLSVSRSVWGGGLLPGCLLASGSWLVHWALAAASPVGADLAGSNVWNCSLLVLPLGVCYFPLMALAPGLTVIDACQLSKKASRLNGEWIIVTFIAALALAADVLARSVPGGELAAAACLVFIGVFNYAAYLDIFERRLDYATQPLLVPRSRRAVALKRPRPSPPPERPRPSSRPWVDRRPYLAYLWRDTRWR